MRQVDAKVLKSMLTKDNWQSLKDVISDTTFKDTMARRLYTILGELHDHAEGDLTLEDVSTHIEVNYQLKQDLRDSLLDEMKWLERAEDGNAQALNHTITKLVQKSHCLDAADYIATHVDDLDFDPMVPVSMMARADEATHSLEADVMDFKSAAPPGMDDRRRIVGLGLNADIDAALGGGVADGEILLYMGPSGTGKTSHMCWSAAYAAKLGCNVLHISCEDHGTKVRQRYDSCLTQLDAEGLKKNLPLVMERRHALPGNIYIQDWSARDVHPSDVRSLVMRLAHSGRPVDYVVVDYIGKMQPDLKMWDGARPFGRITDELRRIGSELQYKTVSGWQTNRAGFDKEVLGATDAAEDIGVFRECDAMIGINQNKEMAKNNRVMHNVIKGRDGTARPARIHYADMDCMNFYSVHKQGKDEPDVENIDVQG